MALLDTRRPPLAPLPAPYPHERACPPRLVAIRPRGRLPRGRPRWRRRSLDPLDARRPQGVDARRAVRDDLDRVPDVAAHRRRKVGRLHLAQARQPDPERQQRSATRLDAGSRAPVLCELRGEGARSRGGAHGNGECEVGVATQVSSEDSAGSSRAKGPRRGEEGRGGEGGCHSFIGLDSLVL